MKTLKITLQTIAFLALLDIAIVTAGLAQIAIEGRTGHWAPFWKVQAEAIVSLIK